MEEANLKGLSAIWFHLYKLKTSQKWTLPFFLGKHSEHDEYKIKHQVFLLGREEYAWEGAQSLLGCGNIVFGLGNKFSDYYFIIA